MQNVKKIYTGKVPTVALKDVSFEVEQGEFLAIMGRSGSGKSTLLHQLGLIDVPTEGRILIDSEDIVRLSDAKRTLFRLQRFGYVFQEYALIAELNALENVYLPAFALGDYDGAYEQRAAQLLGMVELSDRQDHYPHELSGGEQQRVAIARALINRPKILLADEPTASLDSISSQIVLELLQKLNKELGLTILMVSHEPEDIRYVDRVIRLRDGLIEQIENVS